VYFDTNRLIREAFGEAGYPVPVPAYSVSGDLSALALDAAARQRREGGSTGRAS
jgi:small conductance mechanosensitive channel